MTLLPILRSCVISLLFSVQASGLGSTCSIPLGSGTSGPDDPFWLASIKHQGTSPFNPNPIAYDVFRNVKDFGAVGDGIHDDTAAINTAISFGGRCGGGYCASSTVSPAVVYFPNGTYLVTAPIIPYYYTQLIGDAKNPPKLLAGVSFSGMAVIDANPYIPGGMGAQWWVPVNNFHRSIRNFVIDTRQIPAAKTQGTGIHWQVAQATSLINIRFELSNATNTAHQGIWMENGSGGFMGDLVFNGGKYGIWAGSQQFTVRNITVNGAQTAVYNIWNWGWTYQGVSINDCQIGFEIATGGLTQATQSAGANAIIDAVVTNTPTFVQTSQPSNGMLAGSLVLNNIRLNNAPIAVRVAGGPTVLSGGTTIIISWGQGNIYQGVNQSGTFTQGHIPAPTKAPTLLDSSGRVFGRTHPQYAEYAVDQFISVKELGAKGDGRTDDTALLRDIFAKYSGCKIIFFDAGVYVVSDTITIPAGTRMVGEAWTVLAGKGSNFQDQKNLRVVFKVGDQGSRGVTEITDIVFTTIGRAAGAIVIEWNVGQPTGVQAGAGMWDCHVRLGGAAGTHLDGSFCPKSGAGGYDNCSAAFLGIHLTPLSSAYLEGTWVWLSDHDLDAYGDKITLYSGRGIYSESQGPVWLIGTAEHHTLYQYSFANAADHYMGFIQTETPYYQPSPASPNPFTINSQFNDPVPYSADASAWALDIRNSHNIIVFGAGFYSFFSNYSEGCGTMQNCQRQIATVDSASSGINIYSLSTVRTTYQLSVDGNGVINQASNVNGFASTVTSWNSN